MQEAVKIEKSTADIQNEAIRTTVTKERKRLFDFIKQRVQSVEDAEDIIQDVFYQLTESYRMIEPIEKVTSWLFTVARNKITDLYRKKKPLPMSAVIFATGIDNDIDEAPLNLTDIIPDLSDTPDELYMRKMVQDELGKALDELPEDQREVFVMHEFEGRSFREMAEMTGIRVNTLLSRKRYAVLFLREQLNELYYELFNRPAE